MSSDRSAQIIASIGTLLVALLVVIVLVFVHLSLPAKEDDQQKAEILLVQDDEVFVEVVQTVSASRIDKKDASSYLPEPQKQPSQPTPASGTDLTDRGVKKDPAPVVASKEPSPVKVKKEDPKAAGATADTKKKEEEDVKRQANNEVANAFKNASGKHNSQTSNTADTGNSGTNTVDKTSQGTTGTGTGRVGGGWIIPKYAAVRSTVTGSVNIEVRIDKAGHVTSVAFTGGTPPAATDSQVRAAIEREIRARKFSRSSYDDAAEATAYITYTFK